MSSFSDTWSQLEGVAARRKVQNRLAQRKYRQNVKSRGQTLHPIGDTPMSKSLERSVLGPNFANFDEYFPTPPEEGIDTLLLQEVGLSSPASSKSTLTSNAYEAQDGVAAFTDTPLPTQTNDIIGQRRLMTIEHGITPMASSSSGGASAARLKTPHRRVPEGDWAKHKYHEFNTRQRATERRDMLGSTPLHEAARCGHTEVAQLLIARGADPNLINRDRYTALHLAAEEGKVEMVRLLLDHEVSTLTCDGLGSAAIHLAAARGHTTVVALLLDVGVDANSRSSVQEDY